MATSAKTNLVVAPSIKEFVFTEKLGSGTYATVYKAYRKSGPREVVAVKCVKRSSLNKASSENLLTEIELLKTLRHPHIVQLKDFKWDGNYIYLIMEYCGGGDLSAFIRSRRTLSEYLAKRFLQQMALALQYMRQMNVSHLDLKPQNILLSSAQQPCLKIGDFGFAHYLIGETATPYLRGSPLYMAPEMVLTKQYDERADLWSVGVILYECLFGRAPFSSRTLEELGLKIRDSKPVELPGEVHVSSKCRDLLHGLLQRSPDHRLTFDEFFAHAFVDLEHRPSSNAADKAAALIAKAVERDKKRDYQAAVGLYCKALEYFVPAIHYETNPQKKEALRKRIAQYIERAEELKQLLKPKSSSSQLTRSVSEEYKEAQFKELVKLSCDHTTLSAALTVIDSAQLKEKKEDYEGALEQYQLALESLLKLRAAEPAGRRKDLLKSQLGEWMTAAEGIKQYLDVRDLQTKDTSAQEEEDDQRFLSLLQQQVRLQNQRTDNMADTMATTASGQSDIPVSGSPPQMSVSAHEDHHHDPISTDTQPTSLIQTQSRPRSFLALFSKRKSQLDDVRLETDDPDQRFSNVLGENQENTSEYSKIGGSDDKSSRAADKSGDKRADKKSSPSLFGFRRTGKKYSTLEAASLTRDSSSSSNVDESSISMDGSPAKSGTISTEPTSGTFPKKKSIFSAIRNSPLRSKPKHATQLGEGNDNDANPSPSDSLEVSAEEVSVTATKSTKEKTPTAKSKFKMFRRNPALDSPSKYTTLSGKSDSFDQSDIAPSPETHNVQKSTTSGGDEQIEIELSKEEEVDNKFGQAEASTGISKFFTRSPLSTSKLPSIPRPKLQTSPAKYKAFSENDENVDEAFGSSPWQPGEVMESGGQGYNALDYYTSDDSDAEPNSKADDQRLHKGTPKFRPKLEKSKDQTDTSRKSPTKSPLGSNTSNVRTDTKVEPGVEATNMESSIGFDNIGFRTSTSQHSMPESPSGESFGSHDNGTETKWSLMQKQLEEDKQNSQCVLQ